MHFITIRKKRGREFEEEQENIYVSGLGMKGEKCRECIIILQINTNK